MQENKETAMEWCIRKQQECLDKGDTKGAVAYFELSQIWKRREEKDGGS